MTSTAPSTPEPAPFPDAQGIYSVLFPGAIPLVLRERFEQAWPLLERKYAPAEIAEGRRALQGVRDLESLEFACRLGKRLPILSDQVLLMAYLAETLPSHFAHYVAPKSGRLRAFAALAWGAARSSLLLPRGLLLRWRRHV